jgi:hypothetical protein
VKDAKGRARESMKTEMVRATAPRMRGVGSRLVVFLS